MECENKRIAAVVVVWTICMAVILGGIVSLNSQVVVDAVFCRLHVEFDALDPDLDTLLGRQQTGTVPRVLIDVWVARTVDKPVEIRSSRDVGRHIIGEFPLLPTS